MRKRVNSMHCNYCERRCEIIEGDTGFCRMYTKSGNAIAERFPHQWSSCGTAVLESIPFYHVSPGTRCLAIGTASCNFRCKYCSNAFVAKADPLAYQQRMYHFEPAQIVKTAGRLDCQSIVFNVNEPTVSIPSLLEVASIAREQGIPMGCLSNGYMTKESVEILASIFSFFNISLKGLSATFNKKYIGIPSSKPIIRNIRRLARDRHVEVTTPLIEGANDGEINAMADILADIDREIPWHVFRLLPEDEMKKEQYPDISSIDAALKAARQKLPYVYFHNFVGSSWVNTHCSQCQSVIVERVSLGCGGDKLKRVIYTENKCPECSSPVGFLNFASGTRGHR